MSETVSPSIGAPTLSMLLEKAGGSPHESKHAAIEHIKSQLVQIEQQLKASSSPTPPPPLPAPPLDIDDIEIKAEDVYAFRDIDLHIPAPVQTLHKTPRTVEKPSAVKEDEVSPAPVEAPAEMPAAESETQEIKEEPATTPAVIEETPQVDVETTEAAPADQPTESVDSTPALGFPEVRFPAPEIKVLNDKIKEEEKEPEPPAEEQKDQEEDVNVEDDGPVVTEEVLAEVPSEPPPPPTPEPPPAEAPTPVEDQPAPETTPPRAEETTGYTPSEVVEETKEPPLAPEPEPPKEEQKPEPEVVEEKKAEKEPEPTEEAEEKGAEEKVAEVEVKKEEDPEDAIPLKEMAGEGGEGGEEPPAAGKDDTDDDTPMELSRVEELDGKKKRDYSRKKKQDSRTWSGSESAAEASAPESPSASDAERQHRLWKKSVMLVYSRLCAHKYASIFQRPISDEEAPGYSLVVKRPVDLSSIRRNIEAGHVRTTAEFQRDVLLMVSNALMYNSSSHSVYHMAKDMFHEASGQLGMLVAAQAHAGLSSPPARRKRRRDSPPPQPAKRTH